MDADGLARPSNLANESVSTPADRPQTATHQAAVQLRLILTHGSFVVMADDGAVQTCYTEQTGPRTSRSSICSIAALIAFAKDVLQQFPDTDDTTSA